jgi:hypothetical protein
MLWLLARMIKEKGWPSKKTVVLCACDCAETSLQFIPEDEPRPKIAIQTARKWIEGKASKIECKKAADDAYASFAAVSFASSSYAAFAAAASASAAAVAAYAAADAVAASAAFAASAAAAEIYSINRKEALKTKKEFLDILKDKNAWPEVVKWVKENKAETFIEIWNSCERADWMLWIMDKMIKEKKWPSRKTIVLCACDCAETALQFVPEDELRPKIAIQTARKWITGKATIEECKKAADDAYDAYAAYAADADADAYAAHAAAAAARAAIAYAAAYAVSYAATAATAAAEIYSINKKEALKNMADIIRKRVSFEKVILKTKKHVQRRSNGLKKVRQKHLQNFGIHVTERIGCCGFWPK